MLKAPFPYFGGKSRVAGQIWAALGEVRNYIEPFAGSLSVLLSEPATNRTETVNECDLHARHIYLVERMGGLYRVDADVSPLVRDWAVEHGDNPLMRIVLCGYDGEHEMPDSWECIAYSMTGGYSRPDNENRHRERLWLSPHCIKAHLQLDLF